MRRDVQEIFRNTKHQKQVMMFTATLSKEIRPICKKFMHNVSVKLLKRESSLVITFIFEMKSDFINTIII